MRILKSRGVEVLVCLLLISVIFNPTVLKNCFAQVFGPQSLFFDELKTQFVQANAITVIPIGVNSLGNGSRVALNISGVPGASLQYVTNLSTPGPRAAANLILQNPAPGNYTCRVYGIDMLSGNNSISTTFEIFVNGPQNLSPTISPVGVQQVTQGAMLALPISAHRSFGAPSNLNLGISGLPGQFTMDKYVNSPTDVSGTLIWQAAVAPGLYTLKIEVSDTQGAYSTLSVPVLVVSGTTAYPAPVFDELKTQFLATNVDAIIPIGVNALDNSSKIVLTEVVGLPGAALQMVTNPASPGPRAAANLIWKPYAQGQYTCQVTAFDLGRLSYITASFEIFVNGPQNLSPTISPVGVQQVTQGAMLALPISAHRSFGAPSNLNLGISGLPGQFTMDKYVNSPTDVSGTLIWQAAVAPGLYLLSISASDTQGAYVIVQVPIIVGVDITPPTTPVVTANSFSRSTSQLYSSWTSSDTESGVSEYMYQIRQDSATGIVIRDWTSTQNYNYVTAGALSLINGKRYYFCVKAKNGVGLWSGIGYSNGITVDTTPPSKPTVGDAGNYTTSASKLSASWGAYDSISGIAEYQYQILQDSITGAIIKDWTSTGTVRSVALTGLTLKNGKTYYFSVKAKNGAGLWSEVGFSNGIKVDTTAPMTPRVGGEYVAATKALVGSWYSEDAESGIAAYQFRITQNSPTGIVIKGWTSVGTETGYMVTGLNLIPGKSYYFSVKAKNGAGTWSAVGYSNGITVS